MADQLLAATIGVLLEKAVSAAADRIGLALGFGFNKDLEKFKERAEDIQAVLADAEKKQFQSLFVLGWLRRVEAVAIEAEYVLDELLYESLRRKVESMNKAKRAAKVCLFFPLFNKHDLSFCWRMGSKVREINDKLEKFILEASNFGLISVVNTVATFEVATSRETNSLPLQFVAGRAKEVSKIVDTLLSGSSKATASVSVLSIVGMGGLGKTTLAKSIYNNPGIDSHFAKKIWVCVSNKFEATELFRLILESLKGEKVERFKQDVIVQKIREELGGKRFLLILDDVWNEDRELWKDFFTSLIGLNTASGSSCLVTTRSHITADLMSTFPPVELDKLADDDWYILCRKATQNGEMDGEMPQELDVSYEQVLQSSQEIEQQVLLERIKVHREMILKRCQELDVHREMILKRCQGLPLAANVVGGLLSLQKREYWLRTIENKILAGELVEGEITPILKLSFDYLPSSSIKKCFAYCSVYSKDTKIKGKELVELWMTEGFLQEGVESISTMEEIGDDYLTILLQSSLLEKANEEWWGEDTYQMHDLVHDLAESISNRERIDGEVRHLSSNGFKHNAKSTSVRIDGEISDMMLLKFKRLRVLTLRGMKDLPNAIGKLKHLRCLHAPYTNIKSLPGAVCKLYNLQTLDLSECYSLQCLPQELSNLISLRHLHFEGRDGMLMPPNMGRLTCLQTLKFFNVGEEKGYEIEELGSMKNLAGTIRISNLELVKGKERARLANLFEKKRLKGLDLYWGSTYGNGNCNDEQVLEGLEPHPNLQELSLQSYMGAQLPRWFGQLTALTRLILENCKSLKDVPTLGHLPCLEYLEFRDLDNLTCIGESFYREGLWEGKVFPSLKTMELDNLPNLSEWKGSAAVNNGPVFPKLERLVISDCCQLASLPAVNNGPVFPKLESLVIYDCCQLASVPSPFPSLEELTIRGNIPVLVVKGIIGKRASFLKTLKISSMGGLNSLADVIDNHPTRLRTFSIYSCDNLIEIPNSALELCASLDSLSVCGCPKLMPWALNLQRTPSLSSLELLHCPNLFTTNVMPTGFKYLTNLRKLGIGPFTDDSIQSFDWSGLKACSSTLNRLYWSGSLQEHSGLPQQLQHLTSLQFLTLYSLNSVEALPDWLGNLTSLVNLDVSACPILRSLPSAHAMGRLTNLRNLSLYNCPVLPESSIHDISTTLPNLKIIRR